MTLETKVKVEKKANIRNRYNQVPHLTQETVWESDKYTIKRTVKSCTVWYLRGSGRGD